MLLIPLLHKIPLQLRRRKVRVVEVILFECEVGAGLHIHGLLDRLHTLIERIVKREHGNGSDAHPFEPFDNPVRNLSVCVKLH